MSTTPLATTSPPAPPRSITKGERSLAPDIARGGMLLFIALANVPIHMWGMGIDQYNHFTGQSSADHIALFIEQLVIAERSRPMFADPLRLRHRRHGLAHVRARHGRQGRPQGPAPPLLVARRLRLRARHLPVLRRHPRPLRRHGPRRAVLRAPLRQVRSRSGCGGPRPMSSSSATSRSWRTSTAAGRRPADPRAACPPYVQPDHLRAASPRSPSPRRDRPGHVHPARDRRA